MSKFLSRLAVALAVAFFVTACNSRSATAPAVKAKLSVLVRSSNRQQEPILIDQPAALPAQHGGAMYLEVQLDKPAFVYLVWIDSSGRVNPLYPWNNEKIEVTDLNQVPPVRSATNRIFSPMLGRDWQFGDLSGMETVLLLVRRTVLPEDSNLGDILKDLPVPPVRDPDELVVLQLAQDKQDIQTLSSKNRGNEEMARQNDKLLADRMRRLGAHFDLVQAVRFANAGDMPLPTSP